jgi:hypothetical protein
VWSRIGACGANTYPAGLRPARPICQWCLPVNKCEKILKSTRFGSSDVP